jgi:dipeptidase E
MIRIWRETGTDKVLKEAFERDVVLSGLSAGAICWFRWGNSASRIIAGTSDNLTRDTGLDWVNALFCPHYNAGNYGEDRLKTTMVKTPGVAIAVNNCCAIEIVDDNYRIISTIPSANAYRIFWKSGKYFNQVIKKGKEFKPLSELLSK